MVRGVTRSRDRPQDETGTKLDFIAGREGTMPDLQVRALGRKELGALCRKLGTARYIVGMRVGIRRKGDLEAPRASLRNVPIGKPRRINDQGSAVAEVNEIGRMTEAFVDEIDDLCHRSCAIDAIDASA